MRNTRNGMILFLCMLLATGCGMSRADRKGVSNTNTVNEVINEQIDSEKEKEETETEKAEDTADTIESEGTKTISEENIENVVKEEVSDAQKIETTVDYDLTQMGSDMVYATVYQMMAFPEDYEGKRFRIDGNFYVAYYEPTQKYYFYCMIQDATACCAQGMEFVWGDGTHQYPDDYPADESEVVVEGTFETYREEGDESLYCRLSDATLELQNK